jgi:predicted Zn-dependent protease
MVLIAGHVMYELRRNDEAQRFLTTVVKEDPLNLEAWTLLSKVQKGLGHLREADEAARQAIGLLHPESRPTFQ